MKKNIIIVFEGIDHSGKTHQMKLTKDKLIEEGKDVLCLYEPGSTDIGNEIRNILLNSDYDLSSTCAAYLFASARCALNEKIVDEFNKNENLIILCDRHILTSLIYQGSEEVKQINKEAMNILYKNNIAINYIILDLTYDEFIYRSKLEKNIDNFDKKAEARAKDFINAYKNAENLVNAPVFHINSAEDPFITNEKVISTIHKIYKEA